MKFDVMTNSHTYKTVIIIKKMTILLVWKFPCVPLESSLATPLSKPIHRQPLIYFLSLKIYCAFSRTLYKWNHVACALIFWLLLLTMLEIHHVGAHQ